MVINNDFLWISEKITLLIYLLEWFVHVQSDWPSVGIISCIVMTNLLFPDFCLNKTSSNWYKLLLFIDILILLSQNKSLGRISEDWKHKDFLNLSFKILIQNITFCTKTRRIQYVWRAGKSCQILLSIYIYLYHPSCRRQIGR